MGPVHRDEMEIGGVVVEREGSHGVFEVRRKSIHRQTFDVGPVDAASRCSRDVLPVVRDGLRLNASVLGAGAERNEEDTAFQLGIHLKRPVYVIDLACHTSFSAACIMHSGRRQEKHI